jgi:hypothetical protein
MYIYGKIDKQGKQAHIGLRDRRVTMGAFLFPFPFLFLCSPKTQQAGIFKHMHNQLSLSLTHPTISLSHTLDECAYEQPTFSLTHTHPH